MKKLVSFMVAAMMLFTSGIIAVNAKTDDKPVNFYIQVEGQYMDTDGDIASRKKMFFTGSVAQAELKELKDITFKKVLGSEYTEQDILDEIDPVPTQDEVLANVVEDFQTKGFIKDSDGNVVPWAKLNSKYYKAQWYVLKHEADGWHIDGVIVDLKTDEEITIIVPEDPEDIPPEAYDPDPDDEPINPDGAAYAYIFGYEPRITTDEDGNRVVSIDMAMDDAVTVEQVSSMLMRLLDQTGNTTDVDYPVVDAIKPYEGTWFERGLAYQCSVGGFDADEEIKIGNITRGQVAKLVARALRLNTADTTGFVDIDNNPYKTYIERMYSYGYMCGVDDTHFEPERTMTRAEFCSMFNNIIGRDKFGLTALDEDNNEYEVTAQTYNFTDMSPSHWAYEICLKATSAYDDDGYVDINTRNEHIRNNLDKYDGQEIY